MTIRECLDSQAPHLTSSRRRGVVMLRMDGRHPEQRAHAMRMPVFAAAFMLEACLRRDGVT